MARLFLLDGTALAYRSHFALARSGLTTADGRPSGAVYGFTATLRRILREESPDLVAVAMDAKGPTFRHARFADYKATREKAPEEMIAQFADIREVVEAHGITLFEVEGVEADDVIGTLAKQGEAAGHDVSIVTGDKDFMQLVSDNVRLYNVFKPKVDLIIEGKDEVFAKFGVAPDRVVDVLAIMGDASDNVPGVHGIGEKGAQKLIQEFGSVDGLLARLDEVKGKTRERLEEHREDLLMSRELVTIDTHVPVSLAVVKPPHPDRDRLARAFADLDFRSFREEVLRSSEGAEDLTREYITITDEAGLRALIDELRGHGVFAWDTETTGLAPLAVEIVGVSFSCRAGRAYYVPFNASPPVLPGGAAALLEALRPLLEDPELQRVGQNHKYDALVLMGHGVEVGAPAFDTMVASFTVHGAARRHGLDELALTYFGLHKIPTSKLIGTGRNQVTMADVPLEEVAEYACEDADVTWRLYEVLRQELVDSGNERLFYELELPLVPVLTAMERRGIRLDTRVLTGLAVDLDRDAGAAEDRVRALAGEPGLNLNSPKALGAVLFEKLRIQDEAGIKKPKATKTGYATDHATLSEHYADVEIVKALLEYREVAKLKGTYVEPLPGFVNKRTGRVHPHFSQVTAATGRLACSDPNLQNIPIRSERGRALRRAFVAREPDERGEWVLLAADYSQVELRILAHLSGDEALTRAFHEGRDVHRATASKVFGVPEGEVDRAMRSRAKAINFGLMYGMGAQRLARETELTVPEAKEFIERYFAAFPKVRGWLDATLESARASGYAETLMGRRRPLPDLAAGDARTRVGAENAAVNTPVQGSAADIIKRAMIDLELALAARSDLHGQLLLQVHDELLLEVPRAELEATMEVVRTAMSGAMALDVPLDVDMGHGANWLEAH
ncbi:MAG: DNA polymerase I [Planctomycetota bacterium]